MYERVPRNRPPLLQHLDDPVVSSIRQQLNMIQTVISKVSLDRFVKITITFANFFQIEYVPLHWPAQHHRLQVHVASCGLSCFFASCVFLQLVDFFCNLCFCCKLYFLASCVFFTKLCFCASCVFLQVVYYTESCELPTMTCPSDFGRTHFAGIMKSSHSGLSSQLTA